MNGGLKGGESAAEVNDVKFAQDGFGTKTADEERVKRFLENVSVLIDRHESFEKSVADLTVELAELKSENAALVGSVASLERSVERLENAVETLTAGGQDAMVTEVHDRVRRSSNVLLFRMPDSWAETPDGLRVAVINLLAHLGLTFPADDPLAVKRLGVYRGEFRPVLVVFRSPTHAQVVMKNKSRLKAVSHWRNVLVGRDMTVNQRNATRVRNES